MSFSGPVLVTGGYGYIGSRVIQDLRQRGVPFVAVDRQFKKSGGQEVRLDLTDAARVKAFLARHQPKLVIHAGTHSAMAYKEDFAVLFDEDYASLRNIFAALDERCRLVMFSSSYVYSGLPPRDVVTEATALAPQHTFGVAKVFFEQYVRRVHPNSVVLRLSSVYGPGRALHPNAIAGMIEECRATGNVTVWGKGSRMMQYIYIDDVLQAIHVAAKVSPGIYNLGGKEYTSLKEAASIIARTLSGNVVFLRDKVEGESLPRMAVTPLRAHGFKPTSLHKGLQAYISSYGS